MATASAISEFHLDGARGRLFVRRWQEAPAERVVLIAHGYAEHSGRYDHVARHLAARGAAVYAPDHLGHGQSDGERASVEDIADAVSDLALVYARARADHPQLPVLLIGHSLGGVIATRFVQTQDVPLDALVLSAPFIAANPQLLAIRDLDEIPDVPVDPEVLSRDPAVGAAFEADELVYHGPLRLETLRAMTAAVDEIAAGPGFGALPLLYIHGDADELAPYEVTAPVVERLAGPDVTRHVFPGARHEPFNEICKEDVLAAVDAFLERTLAAPAAS